MANTSNISFQNLKAQDTLVSSVNFDGILTDKQAAAVISSAMRRSYRNGWTFTSGDDIRYIDDFRIRFTRDDNNIHLWTAQAVDDDGDNFGDAQTFRSNDLTADSANGPYDAPFQFVFTKNGKSVIATGNDDSSKNPIPYLDRSAGGSISGNVEVMQYDIGILSGNYIQTTTPLSINNYSAANGFMQAESIKYGDPAIGSKAYCILSVIVPEKAIIISGDFGYSNVASKQYPTQDSSKTFRNGLGNGSISLTVKHSLKNSSNTDPSLSDLLWSLALFNIGDTNFGSLSAIEDATIGGIHGAKLLFDKLPDDVGNAVLGKSLDEYVNDFTDVNGDNALYVRGFVELGNQIPPQFMSQHAEGGAVRAIGKYTHAEGRDTIADGRYSHAEGTATIAGGVASHAEGQSTHATGRSSHAEGEGTRAQAAMSHAEGYGSKATEAGAHAEGGYWLSSGYSGNYYGGTASGKASHAEGNATTASGSASHSEGYKTKATNDYAHSEGYSSIASGQYGAHSEGHTTSAVGNYTHAEGKQTLANGSGSHAEGLTSIANSYGSHAEGAYNIVNGNYSHIEGNGDYADKTFTLCSDLSTLYISADLSALSGLSSYGNVKGYAKINDIASIVQLTGYSMTSNELCIYLASKVSSNLAGTKVKAQLFKKYAAGTGSHAEGYNTRALTSYAHAEGSGSYAEGYGTHAEGYNTHAVGTGSHAEGNGTYSIGEYSHAEGASTSAIGKYSHAAGYQTYTGISAQYAHAEGLLVSAYASGSYAGGNKVNIQLSSQDAFAYGNSLTVTENNSYSTLFGVNANTTAARQFVWNGKGWNSADKYSPPAINGTFCINPSEGLNGFYIGKDNFIQCVLSAVQQMDQTQIDALKTALSL